MWFRDHGGETKAGSRSYVASDYRRADPNEPVFAWRYPHLERLILNYLADLDWSALTSARNGELRKLRVELEVCDAEAADLGKQLRRLIDLAKTAGDVHEIGQEISELTARRRALQDRATGIRQQILAKKDFSVEESASLIRQLAEACDDTDSRKRLREIIRSQVTRIELFPRTPEPLLKRPDKTEPPAVFRQLSKARCLRFVFRNEAERWVIDGGEGNGWGVQFDGSHMPPRVVLIRDRGGKMLLDMTQNVKIAPVKTNEWKAKKQTELKTKTGNSKSRFAVGAPKVLTAQHLRDARKHTRKNANDRGFRGNT